MDLNKLDNNQLVKLDNKLYTQVMGQLKRIKDATTDQVIKDRVNSIDIGMHDLIEVERELTLREGE